MFCLDLGLLLQYHLVQICLSTDAKDCQTEETGLLIKANKFLNYEIRKSHI